MLLYIIFNNLYFRHHDPESSESEPDSNESSEDIETVCSDQDDVEDDEDNEIDSGNFQMLSYIKKNIKKILYQVQLPYLPVSNS